MKAQAKRVYRRRRDERRAPRPSRRWSAPASVPPAPALRARRRVTGETAGRRGSPPPAAKELRPGIGRAAVRSRGGRPAPGRNRPGGRKG